MNQWAVTPKQTKRARLIGHDTKTIIRGRCTVIRKSLELFSEEEPNRLVSMHCSDITARLAADFGRFGKGELT